MKEEHRILETWVLDTAQEREQRYLTLVSTWDETNIHIKKLETDVGKMELTVAYLNEAKADTRQSTSTATGTSGEEKNRGLPISDESAFRITQLHPEEPIGRLTNKLHQASSQRPIISSSQKTSSTQANHRPGEQDVSTSRLSAAVIFYNEKNPNQHAVARDNSIVDRESKVLLKINTDCSTTIYPPLINIASMDV